MSHIVQIETEIKDKQAIAAACQRLNLRSSVEREHKLFNGQTATGIAVHLPNWRYPVVCNVQTGALSYDNYNGNWGKQSELDRFKQAYAIEKAKLEARKAGHTVFEKLQSDGSVKLTISLGV